MSTSVILGIDGGLAHMGVVVAEVYGVGLELKSADVLRTFVKDGPLNVRLAMMSRWLRPFFAARPRMVCAEAWSPPRAAGAAAKAAAAYGVMVCLSEEYDVPMIVMGPAKIKRTMGLQRGSTKQQTWERLYELFPECRAVLEEVPKSRREHAADALAAIVGQWDEPIMRLIRNGE